MTNNTINQITSKKPLLIDLAVLFIVCVLFFVLIEVRYPFYFLTDDNADLGLCMYQHTIRSVLQGEFPFYNFHQFCGQRFLGTGQTGSLNIVAYISSFISILIFGYIDAALDIMALLLILIGTSGSYLFLRYLGCTRIPAIIGAIGWNLNSYNICIGNSWMTVIMVTSALPWIYYGTLKLHYERSVFNLLLAVIPKIALFYCGHPQFFIYCVIFDFVFACFYVLMNRSDRNRCFTNFKDLIVEYIVSYAIVTFACLPLMLPMLDLTALSERSEKLSFEAFTSFRIISDVGFYGLTSIVFTFVGILILVLLTTSFREKLRYYKKEISGMLSALPVTVITLLWILSVDFNRIIYLIPILNRFRYQHKLTIITVSSVIIISSLAMTVLEKSYKQKHHKTSKAVFIVLLALQISSIIGIYMATPRKTAGIIYTGNVPFKEEFSEQLKIGRYAVVDFKPISINPDSGLEMIDTTSTLEYDLATYYGFNGVSGYYALMMKDDVNNYADYFAHVHGQSGELLEVYPGFVDEMRKQSVRWYVTDIKNKDEFTEYFKPNGITIAYADDKKIIFEDQNAMPLAYDKNGNEIGLEQKVNTLNLKTPSNFEGGQITLNYAYDEYFICTIDGQLTEIAPGDRLWDFSILCPPGEHHITIRYVERYFVPAMIISVFGIAIVVILLTLYVRKRKIPELDQNRNNRIS